MTRPVERWPWFFHVVWQFLPGWLFWGGFIGMVGVVHAVTAISWLLTILLVGLPAVLLFPVLRLVWRSLALTLLVRLAHSRVGALRDLAVFELVLAAHWFWSDDATLRHLYERLPEPERSKLTAIIMSLRAVSSEPEGAAQDLPTPASSEAPLHLRHAHPN